MTTYYLQADNRIFKTETPEGTTGRPPLYDDGEIAFSSESDLLDLAAGWPAIRLVEIWNCIDGVTPVKKFMNRNRGVARIWQAIEATSANEPRIEPTEETSPELLWVAPAERAQGPGEWNSGPSTERAEIADTIRENQQNYSKDLKNTDSRAVESDAQTNEEKSSKEWPLPELVEHLGLRPDSKNTKIIQLLSAPNGATIQELMDATGWQIHTCQGFIAGTLGTKWGLTVSSEAGQTKYDRRYRILGPGETKPAKEAKVRNAPSGGKKAPTKGELQTRIGELLDFVSQIADEAPTDIKQGVLARKLNDYIQRARQLAGLTDASQ